MTVLSPGRVVMVVLIIVGLAAANLLGPVPGSVQCSREEIRQVISSRKEAQDEDERNTDPTVDRSPG